MCTSFNDKFKKALEDSIKDLEPIFKNSKVKNNYLDISKVQDTDLTKDKPILQFVAYDGVVENICNVKDLQDGINKMTGIFKDSKYNKHYYTRVINYKDYFEIDYGSHYCFFRVTKIGNESLGDLNG